MLLKSLNCFTIDVYSRISVGLSGVRASAWLLTAGALLLCFGAADLTLAQGGPLPGQGVDSGDYRIEIVVTRMFELIEGNLGALIMTVAGLFAIISAALGAYRAAVSLLVVAVGAFILRSLVDIFFNFNENVG